MPAGYDFKNLIMMQKVVGLWLTDTGRLHKENVYCMSLIVAAGNF